MVKIALLVFISSIVLAITSPVPDKKEVSNSEVTNATHADDQTLQLLATAIGDVSDRLSKAYISTYDQQRNSVKNTLDSITDMGKKTVESTVNFLRSGLDFLFLLPTFTKNVASQRK